MECIIGDNEGMEVLEGMEAVCVVLEWVTDGKEVEGMVAVDTEVIVMVDMELERLVAGEDENDELAECIIVEEEGMLAVDAVLGLNRLVFGVGERNGIVA